MLLVSYLGIIIQYCLLLHCHLVYTLGARYCKWAVVSKRRTNHYENPFSDLWKLKRGRTLNQAFYWGCRVESREVSHDAEKTAVWLKIHIATQSYIFCFWDPNHPVPFCSPHQPNLFQCLTSAPCFPHMYPTGLCWAWLPMDSKKSWKKKLGFAMFFLASINTTLLIRGKFIHS